MRQTALEWLEEQMKTWGDLPRWMRDDIVEKAKAMEKEQIVETYNKAHSDGYKDIDKFGEQYYNERFKKSE